MARTFRFKLVVVSVAGLFAAGALWPAYGSPSGSGGALVAKFRRPGIALDPVLSALSAGRLVREVAALTPGQVEVPAVPIGFALQGVQLAGLDVSKTVMGRQELEAFLGRLRGRGFNARGGDYAVYSLPSIQGGG